MIDGSNTSLEWQTHPGDICVLPVGSFEQHAYHLPLETDNVQAGFFARMIAEDLDAALLPALPFGTCMEHSGFRGSFTLRPETMMQIIRDLADEVQRQGFKILIVLNGHGGNFSLGPVVRDINRMDRPLKILIARSWEFRAPEIAADGPGLDIHAGEQETSVMLAIRPDLVLPASIDRLADTSAIPLLQRDLDTFGTGHFSAAGTIGNPSLASPEKGEALIASVRERMLPYLRERIDRLRRQWRYSGSGGIAIRGMKNGDIPAAMRLKALAGWNQTEADWRLFLQGNADGCFVAVHNGQPVGTAAAIHYGNTLAWIGMVLVDPEFRRMGLGTQLLEHVLRSLERYPTVKLDATPAGKEIYAKLGFAEEYGLQRLTHRCIPSLPDTDSVKVLPLTEDKLESVFELDRETFGADRAVLFAALLENAPQLSFYHERAGRFRGFCLGRSGSAFHQIGPVIAETVDDAIALVSAACSHLAGRTVVLDVPDGQSDFLSWLRSLGFVVERPFIRMVRGGKSSSESSAHQFAIAGPEFG